MPVLSDAGTYPEQDAVLDWLREVGVFCKPEEKHRLIEAVTQFRLRMQNQRDKLLGAAKLAYLTVWDAPELGLDELRGELKDAICNAIGSDGFCEWLEEVRP